MYAAWIDCELLSDDLCHIECFCDSVLDACCVGDTRCISDPVPVGSGRLCDANVVDKPRCLCSRLSNVDLHRLDLVDAQRDPNGNAVLGELAVVDFDNKRVAVANALGCVDECIALGHRDHCLVADEHDLGLRLRLKHAVAYRVADLDADAVLVNGYHAVVNIDCEPLAVGHRDHLDFAVEHDLGVELSIRHALADGLADLNPDSVAVHGRVRIRDGVNEPVAVGHGDHLDVTD